MGCWCETDGVTQLPINAGDKVRLFVLVHDACYRFVRGGGAGGGVCYSHDMWSPLGPAIQGTYDDYGGIENIVENDDTQMLMDLIQRDLLPIPDTEGWDREYEMDKMDLSDILFWVERERACFRKIHPDMPKRWLGQFMVHEAVYQAMITHDFIDSEHKFDGRGWIYKPWSQIKAKELREWYENALLLKCEDEFSLSTRIDLTDHFWGMYSESGWRGVRHYRDKLFNLILQKVPFDSEEVQKLCTPVLELIRFSRAMNDARKLWIPQSGKGGQHNEHLIYKRINAAAQTIMQEFEDEMREACDDDGEEYVTDSLELAPWQIQHNEKVM